MISRNAIQGWATTIIGIATMILSLILIWTGVIDFLWEGVGGLSIGCILLMAPKTIEDKVSKLIDGWSGRTVSGPDINKDSSVKPDNPDEDNQ